MTRKMKDSGIEWIGEIPEDWEISKLKYGFYFQKGINSNKYTKEYIDLNKGNYPVYSGQTENDGIMGTINSYDYNINECLFTTTVGAKVMDVRLIGGKFNLSQNCLIMESKEVHFTSYMYYFLQPLFDYERFMIPQYMQPSLRIADLENYTIVAPSFDKQVKISIFLDDKIKTIQNIKDTINQEIQTLEDYKKSIITEAVTKGLDKNVEMKESGIEWIGEIPKHWKKIELRYLSSIVRGGSPRPISNYMSDSDTDLNWIKIGDTEKGSKYINRTKNKLKISGLSSTTYVKKGELILSNSMSYGEAYILNIDGCIHDGWLAFKEIKNVDQEYLYFSLLSTNTLAQFDMLCDGGVVQNLNIDKVKTVKVFIPNLDEQIKIADYLNKKTKLIDDSIAIKQKQLKTLEEYKKSLIYEYVTGKKEVKDGEET